MVSTGNREEGEGGGEVMKGWEIVAKNDIDAADKPLMIDVR